MFQKIQTNEENETEEEFNSLFEKIQTKDLDLGMTILLKFQFILREDIGCDFEKKIIEMPFVNLFKKNFEGLKEENIHPEIYQTLKRINFLIGEMMKEEMQKEEIETEV